MPLPIRPLRCVAGQKEKKEEKKREGVSLLLLLKVRCLRGKGVPGQR